MFDAFANIFRLTVLGLDSASRAGVAAHFCIMATAKISILLAEVICPHGPAVGFGLPKTSARVRARRTDTQESQ